MSLGRKRGGSRTMRRECADWDLLSYRAKRTFFLAVLKKKRIFVRFKCDEF